MLLGVAHAHDVRQFGVVRVLLLEHLAEQPSVAGIVFDDKEKSPDGLSRRVPSVNDRLPVGGGGISVSIFSGHLPP
jgi:hypothetical protein